jgi:hypothetical protein
MYLSGAPAARPNTGAINNPFVPNLGGDMGMGLGGMGMGGMGMGGDLGAQMQMMQGMMQNPMMRQMMESMMSNPQMLQQVCNVSALSGLIFVVCLSLLLCWTCVGHGHEPDDGSNVPIQPDGRADDEQSGNHAIGYANDVWPRAGRGRRCHRAGSESVCQFRCIHVPHAWLAVLVVAVLLICLLFILVRPPAATSPATNPPAATSPDAAATAPPAAGQPAVQPQFNMAAMLQGMMGVRACKSLFIV